MQFNKKCDGDQGQYQYNHGYYDKDNGHLQKDDRHNEDYSSGYYKKDVALLFKASQKTGELFFLYLICGII